MELWTIACLLAVGLVSLPGTEGKYVASFVLYIIASLVDQSIDYQWGGGVGIN